MSVPEEQVSASENHAYQVWESPSQGKARPPRRMDWRARVVGRRGRARARMEIERIVGVGFEVGLGCSGGDGRFGLD